MTLTATALDQLVEETADRLAAGRPGRVAVGAVLGDETALHGAAPDTLFEVGSVSKTFTALALARLVVRASLTWETPLAELLPAGARVPERGGRVITLGHLALHTSGLPALPTGLLPRGPAGRRDPYAGCTADALLAELAGTRPRSTPGARFRYSSFGTGLLGLALARHTGQSYDQLIQREICAPLGLRDTRVELTAEQAARLAPGHSRAGRPRPGWRLADLAGAGGLHSSPADLLKLLLAELGDVSGELAKAVAFTQETSRRVYRAHTIHPGWYGTHLPPSVGRHAMLFHNGRTGGYHTLLALAPGRQAAVVVLSANARSVDRRGMELLGRLVGG
ncbi:serine hydrolase domain-containing protein [Streptomyces sp. DSM 44915]|uniref:Beta-lactamase n=1 Tax=Streptomyces chisholmiae TaxID=3075540 RepID=A0ABU2JXX7_9ACTN|nr:serine hydrolase domain-containing protein [Streptomyces sp. DSM 44915]MDT0269608.1 serine hydrolase domain-containing protein [Streptomyces sp. DSM 44915]